MGRVLECRGSGRRKSGLRASARRKTARPAPARQGIFGAGLLLTLLLPACSPPERTLTTECIAPAAAGGGWDLTCRLVGNILGQLDLAEGVVRTTNMPGAGGGVAFAHTVAQRQGDARLLVAASPATTLRLAQGQYGPLSGTDVRWVGGLGAEYGIVAVAADAPWQTLRELLDAWQAGPRSIVVSGGSTVAGQDHMKILLLGREAGIDPREIRYVPFDGGGEAVTALLGGFVQVFSGEASEVEAHLEAGSLRVLGVLAPERVAGLLGDVPTAIESGYDVTWITWRGFYVPGGVSDAEYDGWVARLDSIAGSPDWVVARERARLRPWVRTGADFEAFVHTQIAEFESMAREIGLIR